MALIFIPIFSIAIAIPPFRWLIRRSLPSPGTGAPKEQRERAFYHYTVVGETVVESGRKEKVWARISGGDAYEETARVVAEAALCLALDRDRVLSRFSQVDGVTAPRGGVITPAAAFGNVIVDRLKKSGNQILVGTGVPGPTKKMR